VPANAQTAGHFFPRQQLPGQHLQRGLPSLKARGFQVKAIEKVRPRPTLPPSPATGHNLVQQLADFTAREVEKCGQPAFPRSGHSLGGFLSLMCAARKPAAGRPARQGRGAGRLPHPGRLARPRPQRRQTRTTGRRHLPGAISRKRKNQWLGKEEVFEHFRGKKPLRLGRAGTARLH